MIKKIAKWIDKAFSKIFSDFLEDAEDIQQYKDSEDEYIDFFEPDRVKREKLDDEKTRRR